MTLSTENCMFGVHCSHTPFKHKTYTAAKWKKEWKEKKKKINKQTRKTFEILIINDIESWTVDTCCQSIKINVRVPFTYTKYSTGHTDTECRVALHILKISTSKYEHRCWMWMWNRRWVMKKTYLLWLNVKITFVTLSFIRNINLLSQ